MRKKVLKFLAIGIFGLIFAQVCSASPLTLINPTNGTSNIPVDDYFQWNEVTGATKYILDIDQFTQSEDNILSSVCSAGVCTFGFLDLTVGNINYLTAYTWGVTAYNAAGSPIDSSPIFSFTSEQAPAPPASCGNGICGPPGEDATNCPADCGGGGDHGGPVSLFNP